MSSLKNVAIIIVSLVLCMAHRELADDLGDHGVGEYQHRGPAHPQQYDGQVDIVSCQVELDVWTDVGWLLHPEPDSA